MDNLQTLVITGGAGFIGSNLVKHALFKGYRVVNLDKLTYAGNLSNLREEEKNDNYIFVEGDICDQSLVRQVLSEHKPQYFAHLAAESHVDRSLDSSGEFIQTNIVGTFQILSALVWYGKQYPGSLAKFVNVSTDEVYGSVAEPDMFTEQSHYDPSSPYSASKASADLLVSAWSKSFGVPSVTTNCSNNYGPHQFPEKLIPHVLLCILNNKQIPVYGRGDNTRDWLHVSDHANAILEVFERGRIGEKYNIGGNCEIKNIDLVQKICTICDRILGRPDGTSSKSIAFVQDRPAHDMRYAIDSTKIQQELGWKPKVSIEVGLEETIRWYLDNPDWIGEVLDKKYKIQRIGLGNHDTSVEA